MKQRFRVLAAGAALTVALPFSGVALAQQAQVQQPTPFQPTQPQQQPQRQLQPGAQPVAGLVDVAVTNFTRLSQALVQPGMLDQLIPPDGRQIRVARLADSLGAQADLLRDVFARSDFLQRNAQLAQTVIRANPSLTNVLQQQNIPLTDVVALDLTGQRPTIFTLRGIQVPQPAQAQAQPQIGGMVAVPPLSITGVQLGMQDTTITLANRGNQPLDLSGARLVAGPRSVTLPMGLRIAPGETVTLHTARGQGGPNDVFLGDEAVRLLSGLQPGAPVAILSDQGTVMAEFTIPTLGQLPPPQFPQPPQMGGAFMNIPLAITTVRPGIQDTTITLENRGNQVIDLSGFRLMVGDRSATLPMGLRIAPGETVTLHTARGQGGPNDVFLGDQAAQLLGGLQLGAQVSIVSDQGNVVAQFTIPSQLQIPGQFTVPGQFMGPGQVTVPGFGQPQGR